MLMLSCQVVGEVWVRLPQLELLLMLPGVARPTLLLLFMLAELWLWLRMLERWLARLLGVLEPADTAMDTDTLSDIRGLRLPLTTACSRGLHFTNKVHTAHLTCCWHYPTTPHKEGARYYYDSKGFLVAVRVFSMTARVFLVSVFFS